VWTTDEGLNGVGIHVANDGPWPVAAELRIALYAGFERQVAEERKAVELPPRSARSFDLEELLGRFVDSAWAYRFGPPAQDLIAVALEGRNGPGARAFHFPAGRPLAVETVDALGLAARARTGPDGVVLELCGRRFVWGLRVHGARLEPTDDAFSLEPGVPRKIELVAGSGWDARSAIELTGLNLRGRLRVPVEE
jgi:beta-mannosidase